MQLKLAFFEETEPSSSAQPTCPPPTAWNQIDEAARSAALEKLAALIARMLANERAEEVGHE